MKYKSSAVQQALEFREGHFLLKEQAFDAVGKILYPDDDEDRDAKLTPSFKAQTAMAIISFIGGCVRQPSKGGLVGFKHVKIKVRAVCLIFLLILLLSLSSSYEHHYLHHHHYSQC